jgi:hypothetical protein
MWQLVILAFVCVTTIVADEDADKYCQVCCNENVYSIGRTHCIRIVKTEHIEVMLLLCEIPFLFQANWI